MNTFTQLSWVFTAVFWRYSSQRIALQLRLFSKWGSRSLQKCFLYDFLPPPPPDPATSTLSPANKNGKKSEKGISLEGWMSSSSDRKSGNCVCASGSRYKFGSPLKLVADFSVRFELPANHRTPGHIWACFAIEFYNPKARSPIASKGYREHVNRYIYRQPPRFLPWLSVFAYPYGLIMCAARTACSQSLFHSLLNDMLPHSGRVVVPSCEMVAVWPVHAADARALVRSARLRAVLHFGTVVGPRGTFCFGLPLSAVTAWSCFSIVRGSASFARLARSSWCGSFAPWCGSSYRETASSRSSSAFFRLLLEFFFHFFLYFFVARTQIYHEHIEETSIPPDIC